MPSILDSIFGGQSGVNPLASIFDSILGRQAQGPPSPSGDMPTRQPSGNDPGPSSMLGPQGLFSLSQGLLSAGGPSLKPTDFGSALGAGLDDAMRMRQRFALNKLAPGGRL